VIVCGSESGELLFVDPIRGYQRLVNAHDGPINILKSDAWKVVSVSNQEVFYQIKIFDLLGNFINELYGDSPITFVDFTETKLVAVQMSGTVLIWDFEHNLI